MLCKQCCRGFLLAFLWVQVSLPAAAYPVFQDDPEKITRMHCQLFLHAISTEAPVTTGLLDTMVAEEGFSAEAGIASNEALQHLTGNLPDFGFVIGDRWMVADRGTRMTFNRLMTQLLAKRGHLQKVSHYTETCQMKLRIIQANPEEDTLPREQRHYMAEATTYLPQASPNEKFSVPLIYALRKDPGKSWEITDLNFFHSGLVATYGDSYNYIIARHGFAGLLEILETELNAPLPIR